MVSSFADLRTYHATGSTAKFGTCSTGGDLNALYRRGLHVDAKARARQGILGADSVDQVLGFVNTRASNLQSVGGFDHTSLGCDSVLHIADVHLAQFINADEPLAARSL